MASPSSGLSPGTRPWVPRHGPLWFPLGRSVVWIRGLPVVWAPPGTCLGDPRHGPLWPLRGRSVVWIRGQPVEWAFSWDPSGGSAAWPSVAPLGRSVEWIRGQPAAWASSLFRLGDSRHGPRWPRAADPSSGSVTSPSCGPRLGVRFTRPVALAGVAIPAAPPSVRERQSSLRFGSWRPCAVSLISWLTLTGPRAPNLPRTQRRSSSKRASAASACSSGWPRAI